MGTIFKTIWSKCSSYYVETITVEKAKCTLSISAMRNQHQIDNRANFLKGNIFPPSFGFLSHKLSDVLVILISSSFSSDLIFRAYWVFFVVNTNLKLFFYFIFSVRAFFFQFHTFQLLCKFSEVSTRRWKFEFANLN